MFLYKQDILEYKEYAKIVLYFKPLCFYINKTYLTIKNFTVVCMVWFIYFPLICFAELFNDIYFSQSYNKLLFCNLHFLFNVGYSSALYIGYINFVAFLNKT